MQFTDIKFEKYNFPNFGYVRLPEVIITDKDKENLHVDKNISNFDFLKALCRQGWKEKKDKFNKSRLKEYEDRIKLELDLIHELDFVDYFLLVWMVINKMRNLDAFIDAGRGSCGASLIFFLLGVTGVDPIDKRLIFSRFISKVRAKKKVVDNIIYIKGDLAPDVDINIGGVRQEIINWLNEIYKGKICKILNLSTFTGKLLVKDVAKIVDGISEDDAKDLANLVEKNAGIVEDIGEMPEKNNDFKKWSEDNPKTFNIALKLRDIIKQKSCHASGYLISFNPLEGEIPLELNKEKELMVGFSKDDAANFAIKLDLLGLTSDEIINDIIHNIPEKVEDIELDNNPIVYNQFQNGLLLPYGLYQISADFALRVTNQVKPKNIYELSDVNALARPGASAYIDDYVDNTAICPHAAFEKVLLPTRNLCLYQEQMMQMAMIIGFTPEESELLRRIVGKKKVDEVKEWKEKIYEKCKNNNFDSSIGDILWKILDDSSKYSFNASHSLSTSYITALTVYLKYKYPLQFYTACLKRVDKFPKPIEEIRNIARELPFFGIELLPPHLTKSDVDFKIEGNNIRFGLSSIKGVSDKTIIKVRNFSNEFANKFQVFVAAEQAGLSVGTLSALIQSGALEGYKNSRSKLVLEVQIWRCLTKKEKEYALKIGEQFEYDLFNIIKHLSKTMDEKGKPIIKETRLETLRSKYTPYKEIYDKNSTNEIFANWFYERTLLGYSYKYTLHEIFCAKNPGDNGIYGLNTLAEVVDKPERSTVTFVGIIEKVVKQKSKNNNDYIKMVISDEVGNTLHNYIFNDNIQECIEKNRGNEPKEGNIVIIGGKKKDTNTIFVKNAIIQDWQIYMKLSDLKDEQEE